MVTTIEIIKPLKTLKNPVLFVGLPGIGLVGKITVDYLIKELTPKPVLVGKIYSDSFPPAVHEKNSVLELIYDEIYLYKTAKQDFLFIAGPVQPALGNILNSNQHYEFSESIASFAKKHKVKEIYTFAGLNIGDKRITSKPRVISVATDIKTKQALEKKKVNNLFFQDKGQDALISGVAGLLLGVSFTHHKIPGICLMGETNSKLTYGDPSSAKQLIEVLINIFKLNVNLKKIDESAKKIEQSFSEISKNLEELSQKQDAPSAPSNYIR
jgi:uncharacterized protein (TIGR00162 family)